MAGPNEGSFSPDAPSLPPGTIIVQQQQTQGPPIGPWPFLIGFLGPLLPFVLFFSGFMAIDRPEPDTDLATAFYTLAMLTAILPVVAVVWQRQWPWTLLPGGVLALLFGWDIAWVAGDSYGYEGSGLFLSLIVPVFTPLFFVALVLLVSMAVARGGNGAAWAMQTLGIAVAGAWGVAALWHLSTLQEQAERARASYETPGLELLAVLAVLVGVALVRKLR